mmetsp:Transcript_23960/g.27596  ORF Transcript_23960/g.27596 Transcript_23960/m.27596 type:complete len:919 (-) Transcript_23960:78-2834(-)
MNDRRPNDRRPSLMNDARPPLRRTKSRKAGRRSSLIHTLHLANREKKLERKNSRLPDKFNVVSFLIPMFVSLWYACGVIFIPGTQANHPFIIWSDGARTINERDQATICPRASICSEGLAELILIVLARFSAFASYVVMFLTFWSKCHAASHFFSSTYVSTIVPFSSFHHKHTNMGKIYACLALLHTLVHYIRWIIRKEVITQGFTPQTAKSGIFAILCMIGIVLSMTNPVKKFWNFERRFYLHWFFVLSMAISLLAHTKRTRIITLISVGVWLLDYIYSAIFRTHRLDVVEFVSLPEKTGTQMLFRNPPGFRSRSGEYIMVKIPWLSHGGDEWHPFSLYLSDETHQGLEEVLRSDRQNNNRFSIFAGADAKGGVEINPGKTALLLVEMQNEFASPRGELHESVKAVMKATNMLKKTVDLAQKVRDTGAQVFHAPIIFGETLEDFPNANVPEGDLFMSDSWNAEIVVEHKPKYGDSIIKNKYGLDCFAGTNLEDLIKEKGIETLIIGGFLTNCSVESTMRTAFEKGLNVVTLTDGTACRSEAEQSVSTNYNFTMFSTPVTCAEAEILLDGSKMPNTKKAKLHSSHSSESPSSFDEHQEEPLLVNESTVPLSVKAKTSFPPRLLKKLSTVSTRTALAPRPTKLKGAVSLQSYFPRDIAKAEDQSEKINDIKEFISHTLLDPDESMEDDIEIRMHDAAREDLNNRHQTTQIFISPAGDWSKGLQKEMDGAGNMSSSCWVKGPYTSPYFVATNFSHIILTASGVGLTPALGVMGQYPGDSRSKVLIWMTRDRVMIKFFAPQLGEAHIALIFYTGRIKLTPEEINDIQAYGSIFIQQTRPESLSDTVTSVIFALERGLARDNVRIDRSSLWGDSRPNMDKITLSQRADWVILYCGGSVRIESELKAYSDHYKINFQSESFAW